MKKLDFSSSRVLVVGDVMLDCYVHGSTSRISPEAPVPVVRVEHEEARLGGAGNVAVNIAVLGAGSGLIGLVGNDATADRVDALLGSHGVECRLQRVEGCRTITKQRILSRHQQLIRIDFEDAFPHWNVDALQHDFQDLVANADAVVLSDYGKGTLGNSAQLIAAARALGRPVIVDPKGRDFERYRGATVITPNVAEFEAVVGPCADEAMLVERGTALRDALDLEALLITRSERGMTLLARGRAPLHLPTRAQEVYDVTGAGDTVVAMLATALGAKMPLAEAVVLSNFAAGVVVAKVGTATVTLAELEQAMRSADIVACQRGLHDEAGMLQQMEWARGRGERVVMTNGCFDILHPGHIDYLEKARALGDRLVVAVNDDASVRRLKGAQRPVNPLATRMRMLSALACVDWVIPFSEDTPERVICALLPDLLVKGGDYTEQQIAGGDCVKAAGGAVRVLDFLPGHSTTQLIHRIQGATP